MIGRRRPLFEPLEARQLLASFTTLEDTPLVVTEAVLVGATVQTAPAHGTFARLDGGGFKYAPALNYNGPDAIVYRAAGSSTTPNTIAGEPQTITISVTPVNDAPEARNDIFQMLQGTTLAVVAPGVLKNDSDTDSEHFIAKLGEGPSHGTVTLNEDGSFTYVPSGDFAGYDSFTYRASDGQLASNVATVGLYVQGRPKPEARPDAYSTLQNTPLTLKAPGVLANDSGINGRPLTASVERAPEHGKLELKADGSFIYTPSDGYSGGDSFVYRATDVSPLLTPSSTAAEGTANPLPPASSTATVTISVKAVPTPPEAHDDAYATLQGTTLQIAAPGVLANDRAVEGHALQASLGEKPQHGTLTLDPKGSFTYVPDATFSGYDWFTYKANDVTPTPTAGSDPTTNALPTTSTPPTSAVARVNIYVQAVHPPVYAYDDSYTVQAGRTLVVAAPGVLGNDSLRPPILPLLPAADSTLASSATNSPIVPFGVPSPFKVTLAAKILANPAHGEIQLGADGSFKYVPAADFTGADTFAYQATATVGLGTGDTPPGTSLLVAGSLVAAAALGTSSDMPCQITADGQPSCPPIPVVDDIATVTIYVKAPEPPPTVIVAKNDSFLTAEGTPLDIRAPGVLANDSTILATPNTAVPSTAAALPVALPLSAVLVASPAHGQLTLRADGSFHYVPNDGFTGNDTFTYQASATYQTGNTEPPTFGDGSSNTVSPHVLSNVATVTISVIPVIAHNDVFSTVQDTGLVINKPGVLANDGGGTSEHPLAATLMAAPVQGTLDFHSDGSFRYVPPAGFTGAVVFVYRAAGSTILPPASAIGGTSAGIATTNPGSNGDPSSFPHDVGIVTIYVRPQQTAIEAHGDAYKTPKGVHLDIAKPGVLSNDTAPSGVNLAAKVVNQPSHGTLTLAADGSFHYQPTGDYVGEDKFTYQAIAVTATAAGTIGETPKGSVATVTIYVLPTDPLPKVIVGGDHKVTDESNLQDDSDSVVVTNDTDAATQPKVTITTDHPELFAVPPSLNAEGRLVYKPAPNVSGTATVTVTVLDDNGAAIETHSFKIDIEKPHPLYNTANPVDVTHDNTVAPLDAITVINYLNDPKQPLLAAGESSTAGGIPDYLDVSGDNMVTPLDALLVINYLNSTAAKPASSGEEPLASAASQPGFAAANPPPSLDDTIALLAQDADAEAERRRRAQ